MSAVINPTLSELNDCGCCEGLTVATPIEVTNRPGLTAIAYRVGIQPQFKQSMLARLSAIVPGLRTRADDDFAIALLDAWATVADVLTFYQEHIANESYLRTATERRSLLELARLLGYEPRSGVAASTVLAFTIEDAPGAPPKTTINSGVKVLSIPAPGERPQTFETIEQIEARAAWNALKPQLSQPISLVSGSTYVYLKGIAINLKPGDALLFVGAQGKRDSGGGQWDFRRLAAVTPDPAGGRTRIEWEAGLESAAPPVKVYALRQRASLFGYNAPQPATLSDQTLTHYGLLDKVQKDPTTDWSFDISGRTIDLDAIYSSILPHGWLLLSRPEVQALYRVESVIEASRTAYTLSTRTSRITLDRADGLSDFAGAGLRTTAVFAQSELLEVAEEPLTAPIDTGANKIALAAPVAELPRGRLLVVLGTDEVTGDLLSELVTLADISTDGSTLTLDPPLANRYVRAGFTINANVARATHGETVQEALGGGDAGQPYQRFILRQPPLTYVSSTAPGGADSTLQVRANDLLWREAPTLYGRGPDERVFVTHLDDAGKTTVQFGDGVTGARLPTGQENVRATYRKGTGVAGNLQTGQISLLTTRPLGVRSVTNPLPASGGDDPESRDDVRRNAPFTVLALDRIVSLQDYEDFARAFAGVAKALATRTWSGHTRGVLLTVAGPEGAAVTVDSATYANLLAAMQKAGDPYVPVRVQSYRQAFFTLAATVTVDPDTQRERVLAGVEATLRDYFSFAARAFGQPVTLSEVLAVIQAVAGVLAVDVDILARTDGIGGDGLRQPLPAALPQPGVDGTPLAAELLLLDPGPLNLVGRLP